MELDLSDIYRSANQVNSKSFVGKVIDLRDLSGRFRINLCPVMAKFPPKLTNADNSV